MLTHEEMVGFQSEKHSLVNLENFKRKDHFVLHLIHLFAYQNAAEIGANKAILDLGCNVGYGTNLMSLNAKSIIGVDVSKAAIEQAKANFPTLKFQEVDGKTLPFNDNSFDIIISCQVIEHIVDLGVYMAEIKRVLADDGVVVFTTPNAAIRLDDGMKPWYKFHVKEYKYNELEEALKEFFLSVSVQGLFADYEIYNTEINRVTLIREKARIKQKFINKRFINYVKYRFKKITYQRKNKISPAIIEKLKDHRLYYKKNRLEESLDFIALCSNNNDAFQDADKKLIRE